MSTRVLALLALQVVVANCFSWDIVVGIEKRLEFYYNGTLTHKEDIPSAIHIDAVTYDPVHNRVLFADRSPWFIITISSFDLLTRKIQTFVMITTNGNSASIDYDPVTQLLFWMVYPDIYSMSLNPASSKTIVDRNRIVKLDDVSWDIAVDSCGGYIYWTTDSKIERIRLDGSNREVLIDDFASSRVSLAIDQQTQRMYWVEKSYKNNVAQISIESADFNGKNRKTLLEDIIDKNETLVSSLAVSKDFIYWRMYDEKAIWQSPKIPGQQVKTKIIPDIAYEFQFQIIAANYSIQEQTEGNPNCDNLYNVIPNALALLCVHGTKISGTSRCECTQGYTGDRCDVAICQNYCLQGDCSVSAEGQPTCRCEVGYSGKRCEVNACHKYCLNNGYCSLNEEDEPFCECSANFEGERCEVLTINPGQSCSYQKSKQDDVLRDLRKEVRQAVKEELQHTSLQFVSNKIDEYEVHV